MRTIFSVVFSLFLVSIPLKAVAAEGPMELAEGSNAGANKHNKAGIKHWGMGHADEALKHFKEAGAADSSIAEIHFNEAVALDKMGDHGAATKHFKKAYDLAIRYKKIVDSPILKGHLGLK